MCIICHLDGLHPKILINYLINENLCPLNDYFLFAVPATTLRSVVWSSRCPRKQLLEPPNFSSEVGSSFDATCLGKSQFFLLVENDTKARHIYRKTKQRIRRKICENTQNRYRQLQKANFEKYYFQKQYIQVEFYLSSWTRYKESQL